MTKTLPALILCIILAGTAAHAQEPVGIFENHADVGTVLHAGSATFDKATGVYALTGSGDNMWLANDAFQFVWKKISGDVELTADISFATTTGNEHKKAVLMFRQSLDPDSVYVDVALHGNGLTALQYRDQKGDTTREIQSSISNHIHAVTKGGTNQVESDFTTARLRLTRRGDYVYLSFADLGHGDSLTTADWVPGSVHYDGESIRVPLTGDIYVGIGVCAHDKDVIEKAMFLNVKLRALEAPSGQQVLHSTLETISVSSTDRKVVYHAEGRFEAPNWSRDGSYLLFNRNGHLEKLPVAGGRLDVIDTDIASRLNNDHGISPDGTLLAVSDNSQETKSPTGAPAHDSLVYTLPIAGGAAHRITQNAPSYWHGWSPDGKTLAFVGQRNGEFDIYTIPVGGGDETRLTTAKGLDDGPEYSPDGQYIYFNSERTGHMQIWRMHADGSNQEQVFSDDYNNWFPHISPDGKWMVFLTYEKDVTGHPENKDVMLRLMSLSGESTNDKKIAVLAKLFGGQGTINVPSWSPDSKWIAFVSYQFIAPENAGENQK
jgi:Tol biopolymer transport system component